MKPKSSRIFLHLEFGEEEIMDCNLVIGFDASCSSRISY